MEPTGNPKRANGKVKQNKKERLASDCFLESGDPGWVRTVWLKHNHASSHDNWRTVQLKIKKIMCPSVQMI